MLQSTARRCLASRSLPMNRSVLAIRQYQTSSRLASKGADTAFSPDNTRPEEQKEAASEELNDQGFLSTQKNESPATPEVSQPRPSQEGGSQGSASEEGHGASDRSGPSGSGSPPKAGGGKSGGGGAT